MGCYLLRRMLYAIPILLGVNLITFVLFFVVNSPDDMARMQLGHKHVTQEAITEWKHVHGYNNPLFFNAQEAGFARVTQTLFVQKSLKLFLFDFGSSDTGRDISNDIEKRMWPSFSVALPALLMGLLFNITFALILAFFRASYLDRWGVLVCVMMMSVSGLFYIIGGKYLIGKLWHWVPISGYAYGFEAWIFVILPVVVSLVSGVGSGTRWYRVVFLEEFDKEYVRTARAKGLSERVVLFKHILRNALVPIVTNVVVIIPSLFLGSLLLESFFSIPGLGSYTLEAINQQDFAIVRSMVFLGTILYIIGLLLTDVCYTLIDPRIRLS